MLSRTCRPSGHPVSGNDPGSSFAPWSRSARSARSATRRIATQPWKLTARLPVALPPLRTAAAFGLRRDSSRLVDEVAHRCGRGVIAPPAPLGPGWRVTSGGVMAGHWQDACVDAVAKLPPLRARRFSETIRVELGAFLCSDDSSDSSTRWRTDAVAVSSLRPHPWDLVGGVAGGRVMARHWQDACVDAVGKLLSLPARRLSGTIPDGASRLPSNRDATTGRLTTAHDWRRHRSRSQAGGILVGATVAVSWLPYGEAPAGGVGRCCREGGAHPSTAASWR